MMKQTKHLTTLFSLLITLIPVSFSQAATPLHSAKYEMDSSIKANIYQVYDKYGVDRDDYDSYIRKSVDQIRLKLKKRGYKSIKTLDRASPVYKFSACRDGKKYKLYIRDDGKLNHKARVGYCGAKYTPPARDYEDGYGKRKTYNDEYHKPRRRYDDGYEVSPAQVRRILRRKGYNRIAFTDRYLPVYKVNACRNDVRYKVHVGYNGAIRKSQRIGYCSTGNRFKDYWRSPRKFR